MGPTASTPPWVEQSVTDGFKGSNRGKLCLFFWCSQDSKDRRARALLAVMVLTLPHYLLWIMAAPSNARRIPCRALTDAHLLLTAGAGFNADSLPASLDSPELVICTLPFLRTFFAVTKKCHFLLSTNNCCAFRGRTTSRAWQLSGDNRRGRRGREGLSDSPAIRPEEERSLWASLQRNSSENARGEQEQ